MRAFLVNGTNSLHILEILRTPKLIKKTDINNSRWEKTELLLYWRLTDSLNSPGDNCSQIRSWQLPIFLSLCIFECFKLAGIYIRVFGCSSSLKTSRKLRNVNQYLLLRTSTWQLWLLLLSHFSRLRLCVTPQMAAHQAPPSLGFFRQEHWSGLPFPSPMHESEKFKWSRSVISNS